MAEDDPRVSCEKDSNSVLHEASLNAEPPAPAPSASCDGQMSSSAAGGECWSDNVTLVFGVFAFCFILYAVTAYPDQAPGDSGELVAAAYQLGLGHPPGYPLFCLIGKLWSMILPFGTVAWRMNIGNAVAGAAAAATVALLGARFSRSNIAGALAGIGFGLCPVVCCSQLKPRCSLSTISSQLFCSISPSSSSKSLPFLLPPPVPSPLASASATSTPSLSSPSLYAPPSSSLGCGWVSFASRDFWL